MNVGANFPLISLFNLNLVRVCVFYLRGIHMPDGEVEFTKHSMVLGPSEQLVVPIADLNLLK